MACPLCNENQSEMFFADKWREYEQCCKCQLIFVPNRFHLSRADEKEEYDLHQNGPNDPGYRRFLDRLFQPIIARLKPASHGLDFGSGPGPTLSVMFQESGHTMSIFDPFYAPGTNVLEREYDFVTASEVVEHLCRPREDLERVWACVKPGGVLGIMTKLSLGQSAFASWHYRNDRTHVSFFSRQTFEWLAIAWNAKLEFHGHDVVTISRQQSRFVS